MNNFFYQISFDLKDFFWQLSDGRVWSTAAAAFVEPAAADTWLMEHDLKTIPQSPTDPEDNPDNTKHGEPGLIYALRFYGLPLGELTPPEEAYEAERALVDKKYTSPWDGQKGGLLTSLQMTMLSAQAQGLPLEPLQAEYDKTLTAMAAEYDAIDEKYGV